MRTYVVKADSSGPQATTRGLPAVKPLVIRLNAGSTGLPFRRYSMRFFLFQ